MNTLEAVVNNEATTSRPRKEGSGAHVVIDLCNTAPKAIPIQFTRSTWIEEASANGVTLYRNTEQGNPTGGDLL
jgi:hypothetical protein